MLQKTVKLYILSSELPLDEVVEVTAVDDEGPPPFIDDDCCNVEELDACCCDGLAFDGSSCC